MMTKYLLISLFGMLCIFSLYADDEITFIDEPEDLLVGIHVPSEFINKQEHFTWSQPEEFPANKAGFLNILPEPAIEIAYIVDR